MRARVKARLGVDPYEMAKEDRRERYDVMSCHVMSCHVMSCHVMSCHVMSCDVMCCDVTGCVMR